MPACPICEKSLPAATKDATPLPFCSPRCKLLDLDNWLGGRYVVSQALPFDEDLPLEKAELEQLHAELGDLMKLENER